MTPEERASKAMAECVAENGGKNVAYYLAKAIREAVEAERRRKSPHRVFNGFSENN